MGTEALNHQGYVGLPTGALAVRSRDGCADSECIFWRRKWVRLAAKPFQEFIQSPLMMSSFHLPEDIPSIAVSATYSACERRSVPAGARTRHFGGVKKSPQPAKQALNGQIRGNVRCDMVCRSCYCRGLKKNSASSDFMITSFCRCEKGPFFRALLLPRPSPEAMMRALEMLGFLSDSSAGAWPPMMSLDNLVAECYR